MYLHKLSFVNFKNYEQLDLEFSPKINCLIGSNGVGKTNVLDAIYYLSMCKSYFNVVDSQNIRWDQDFFVIQGRYLREEKQEQIYCGVKKHKKKKFKRNKKDYEKLSDHIGLFPVVMISPSDSKLILEGSDERRKYMNGVISQFNKNYLNNVISYNNALLQRNKLLKDFAKNSSFDKDSLEIWDDQLIKYGIPVFEEREKFVKELIPIFQKYYRIISGDKETVSLQYRSDLQNEDFSNLLINAREKDQLVQHTTTGIHKDDFDLQLSEHPIKKVGSQGQQKTFLVALKLAQFDFISHVKGFKPLLLLDDIFDKFDMSRVNHIIQLVADNNFGQIFITDTNADRLDKILKQSEIKYNLFSIEADGKVKATE